MSHDAMRSDMIPERRKEAIERYVLAHASGFQSEACPADVRRGKVGTCFDTSMLNALYGKYAYVEGLAKDVRTGEWLLHGWVTDRSRVYAYDPTWRAVIYAENGGEVLVPVPTTYRGIVLDMRRVAEFVRATGYASVIANAWRAPELAREALPDRDGSLEDLMTMPV